MERISDFSRSAAALYDGGWRADDLEQLIAEYELCRDDAVKLCEMLAEMDKK